MSKNTSCMNAQCNSMYGIGLLGALVFYIQQAQGFGEVLFALLKSFLWPAFLVYELLKFI